MMPDLSDGQDACHTHRAPADHHDHGRYDRLVDTPKHCGGDMREAQDAVEQAADPGTSHAVGDDGRITAESSYQLRGQKEHHHADGFDHQDHTGDGEECAFSDTVSSPGAVVLADEGRHCR